MNHDLVEGEYELVNYRSDTGVLYNNWVESVIIANLGNSLLQFAIKLYCKIVDVIQKSKDGILWSRFENTLWELCKIKIWEYSVKYAFDCNKKKKWYLEYLGKKYIEICQDDEYNESSESVDQKMKLLNEIDKWYKNNCKGAFLRALSQRLKVVINVIVSFDQSGFMKGRIATEKNVRSIL